MAHANEKIGYMALWIGAFIVPAEPEVQSFAT